MSTSHVRSVFTRRCKKCGEFFTATGDAIAADLARGLSEPARCTKCRHNHGRFINAVGAGYFLEKRKREPHPRCVGKLGLGQLYHPDPELTEKSYDLRPTPEQLEKFKILDPAVQRLIANLEDPNGARVSILVGPTGTGKSVWAPTQILRSPIGRDGRICVTQPRLVTLRSAKGESSTTPGFVAKSLLGADAVGAGQEVGLLYSGESTKSDRYTRLLYVTDGILIRWILSGQLGRFSVVMIDEAHEQSTNMELIFALMRYHLPLYPRLRLVIMSATMDVKRFENFFGDGKPGSVFVAAPDEPATLCQIFDRWPDGVDGYQAKLGAFSLPTQAKEIPEACAAVVRAIRQLQGFTLLGNPGGDILCFAPTVRTVDTTVRAIKALGLPGLEALPCHAKMLDEEVEALQASETRARHAMERGENTSLQRVIVATNYAETSVTFANLRYVIDSGFIMEPVWSPTTCSMEFPVRRHSQAGCTQRKGRVGRVQDGEVFRLYTQEEFKDATVFPEHPRPAIAREPLEKFLLAAKAAGIANLDGFRWLGFDENDALQSGERTRSLAALSRHRVVDAEGDITSRGLELEGLRTSSLDWSLAMSESDSMACALEVATFLAFTDLQRKPFAEGAAGLLAYARWSAGCVDDLEFYLRLYHHWKSARQNRDAEEHAAWSRTEGLNHKAFREIEKAQGAGLEEFAERTHTDPTERALDLARIERVRMVLCRVLYPWVYVLSSKKDGSFSPLNPDLCPCKADLWIDHESACHDIGSIEAFLCVSRRTIKERVVADHIVRVDPKWLEIVKSGTATALALFAKGSIMFPMLSWQSGAAERIEKAAEQAPTAKDFRAGELRKFRVVRFKRGETRHTVLTTDVSTEKPVVLSFEGGTLHKDDIVRVHVEDPPGEEALRVHQRHIIAAYTPETLIGRSSTKLTRELTDDTQPKPVVIGHVLQLQPGVHAMLRRHPDQRFWLWWRLYLAGECQTLRVLKNDGRILLGLHYPKPSVHQTYRGVVDGVQYQKDTGRVLGLKVMFLPGMTGMVFWRTVPRGTIERYSPGEEVSVQVTSEKQGQAGRMLYDLQLLNPKGALRW